MLRKHKNAMTKDQRRHQALQVIYFKHIMKHICYFRNVHDAEPFFYFSFHRFEKINVTMSWIRNVNLVERHHF